MTPAVREMNLVPAEQAKPFELDGLGVYKAINRVTKALSVSGIAKDRRNTQGSGYSFRGIDDVFNALSPLLAEHGLCIIPRMLDRQSVERQSKAGGALFYITVMADFDFVSSEDGSRHTVRMFGEAMDSGDKATNKAMSAAYKYAAFQTFCIPVEGTPDADADTHEVAVPQPTGFTDWLNDLAIVAKEEGAARLESCWKASAVAFRKHLVDTDKAKWEAMKKTAAAVKVDAPV